MAWFAWLKGNGWIIRFKVCARCVMSLLFLRDAYRAAIPSKFDIGVPKVQSVVNGCWCLWSANNAAKEALF